MNYDTLFVNPNGATSRAAYVPAMITLLAVIAFYAYIVTGRTAQFAMLTLLYPAFVLLARRFRNMGSSVWLLLTPLVLMLATFVDQLGYVSLSVGIGIGLKWLAYLVLAAFILWGGFGESKT